MDFKELALEFVKLYFSCHPDQLPTDKEKAFQEMNKLHGKYKSHLIDKATKKSEDFFSDKF
jgi:curved DNA-binding protein CbpA